jgi:sugar phosphate isomerase/epimerase
LKLGAALIPLVGWGLDAERPEATRAAHLGAIRRIVDEFGLGAVELNGDFTVLYPHIFDGTYYARVGELQRELGFVCTLHLPFLWLDGLSLAEPVREATVRSVARVLELTVGLSIESYVLHLWGAWSSLIAMALQVPDRERVALLARMCQQATRTLVELGGLVSPERVCVENMERFPFEEIVPLVQMEGMRICLDVGHLAVQGGDPIGFLDQHWEMIGEVHLHDADSAPDSGRVIKDHLPLGSGEVDYVAFLERLREGGYDKVLILELNTEADLLESLKRVRPWL